MLDLHTLEKTVNWLEARKAQETSKEIQKSEFEPMNAVRITEKETKIKLLDDLINKLAGKTSDIRTAIESGGEMGALIPGKQTNTKHEYKCPVCGGKRSLIRSYFSDMHVKILKKIFKYCIDHKTHFIQTSEIGLDNVDYCNIAQLQRYGFLYYPNGKENKKRDGKWGVAVKRVYEFLQGKWKVAEYSQRDTVTKEQKVSENRVSIHQIKRRGLYTTDNAFLLYFIEYREQVERGVWE